MRAFDKAIFRWLLKTPARDEEPEVVNDPDAEDGGPGSGNWGHRGRPGLRGGSGKGGGAQYRGGRADMGNFYGSREDWLNGLNGERQREVTNTLKFYGNGDIKAGEKAIMQGKNMAAKRDYVRAMAEARKWDEHAERLYGNLEEKEQDRLDRLLNKLQGENIGEMLDDTDYLTKSEQAELYDLMSKAMGGETSGQAQSSKLTQVAEDIVNKQGNGYPIKTALNALTGQGISPVHATAEDVERMLSMVPAVAFKNEASTVLTQEVLSNLSTRLDYAKQLQDGEDELCKKNLEILKSFANPWDDLTDSRNIELIEPRILSKMSPRQMQEYLSNKWQILTGGEPLQVTAFTMRERQAQAREIAQQRKDGTYQGKPDSDLGKAMGGEYKKLNGMVSGCGNADIVSVWDGFESEIRVLSTSESKEQRYIPGKGIMIDARGDMEAHGIYSAGEIVFHESGHMIDDLIGRERGLGGFYSEKYNNGEFTRTLHDEVWEYVKAERKKAKSEVDQHRTITSQNADWLLQNGLIDWWGVSKMQVHIRENGEGGDIGDLGIKFGAKELNEVIKRRLNAEMATVEQERAFGAICDAVQGVTKSAIELKIGHKASYYKGGESRHLVSTEVFAELMAGHVTNPKVIDAFRQRFPKTYAVYERMMADVYNA